MARKALHFEGDALGPHAGLPLHVHREHRRLLRTKDAASPAESVPAGTSLFTLLGFAGLYLLLGIVFLMLIVRIVNQGPEAVQLPTTSTQAAAGAGEA